ncbi:MAG: hypothetical protein KAX44_08280 [Candidatus Brocadiae bacterium]|nr:hypothetical protein [Candidatus Brocadiia bacterium]
MGISDAVALLSLVIACTVLFLTQFRRPRVGVHFSPVLKSYYRKDGSLAFYLTVTFDNSALTPGLVRHVAMVLHRRDNPKARFLMPWRSFASYSFDEKRWWATEMARALAVPGRSSVDKTIWFAWEGRAPDLALEKGEYEIELLWWDARDLVRRSARTVHVTERIQQKFQEYREKAKTSFVDLPLDAGRAENRVLNPSQYRALLRGPGR